GATHHPLELYDSNDPTVIRKHLEMSAAAGIDVLVATWWGQDDYHDRAFRKVIREAQKSPVQVTIYYERVPAVTQKSQLVDAVVEDLRYVLDSYAKSSAFFAVDGKPVIFIYGRAMHQLGIDAWTQVVERVKASRPVMLIGDSTSAEWADIFDGLHTYNPVGAVVGGTDMFGYYQRAVRTCRSASKIAAVTVIPGYDDSHIGRSTPIIADREDGSLYKSLLAAAVRSDPDWLVITSFNEWHEGSEIEPSREHGRLYLDLTHRYAAAFKGEQTARGARIESAASPDGLVRTLTTMRGSGHLLSNLDSRYGTIRVAARHWKQPVIFELGREGRHLRRTYPSTSGGTLKILTKPFTDYAIYAADDFVDLIIRSVCGLDPNDLTRSQKLQAVQEKLRQLDKPSSNMGRATGRSKKLLSEAYQVLLGVDFSVEMRYQSDAEADYKLFAGRHFSVTLRASNGGSQPISEGRFALLPPDEWASRADWPTSFDALRPGESAISRFKLRVPANSTFRPKTFPVIGMLTIRHDGGEIVLHHPIEVTISDPFTASLSIA
ncbi:MAG: glycoside hydrolase family 99-like domain-containing protein, partial [Candidatus Hydrogenedentota bacterium]